MGASQQSRWSELVRGSVINGVLRSSGPIDVHVISTETPDREPGVSVWRPRTRAHVSRRRWWTAWALAVVRPAAARAGPDRRSRGSRAVERSAAVPRARRRGRDDRRAAAGGARGGVRVAARQLLLHAADPHVHDRAGREPARARRVPRGRRGRQLARQRRESAHRRRGARPRRGGDVGRAWRGRSRAPRTHFRSSWPSCGPRSPRRRWRCCERPVPTSGTLEAAAGEPIPTRPDEGTASVPIGVAEQLVVAGPAMSDEDLDVLRAFAAQVAIAVERRRLRADVAAAAGLAEANELRTALLAAVSHDLRTPLASIKASVTSLLQRDVEWTGEATTEFLETIDEESDRLNALVGNLLDMSRLQTGAVQLVMRDGRAGGGGAARARRAAGPRGAGGARPPRDAAAREGRRRAVGACGREHRRQRACVVTGARGGAGGGRGGPGPGGPARHRPRSRDPGRTSATSSSSRSSAWATTRATAPASDSASPSPAGSSRRWAAS